MTFTSDAEIKSTTDAFMAKTLPKPDWTHEAHFAVALCLLADETRDVFREMPLRIRAYNEATGVANTETEGYHETITLACLRGAAAHLRAAEPTMALYDVLADLMAGPMGRSDWLLTHWSRSVLFTPRARRTWVAPNLQPLRF